MQILKEFYLYYFLKVSPLWRIIICIIFLAVVIEAVNLVKKNRLRKSQAAAGTFLLVWLIFVFVSTVLSREIIYQDNNYNLTLFWELKELIKADTMYVKLVYARGIGYNILMLLPLGLLVPVIFDNKFPWWSIMLFGMIFSITIELLQLVTKRGFFEFDDIINNTIGVVLGYLLYKGIKYFSGRKLKNGSSN